MKIRASEFKVGIFVIFALAVLVAIVRFLSPETFKASSYRRYHVIAANAEGVVDKTHVRTNGVTVGKVLELELLENETKIIFGVEEDVFIPVGSKVEIRSRGLLGDKFIEVLRSDATEEANDGSELQMSKSALDTDKMMAMASDIASDVKRVTGVLAEGFDPPEGESGLNTVMKDLSITLSELKTLIKDNRVRVEGTLTHLERASRNIADVMEKHGDKFDGIIGNLESVSGSLRTVFENESGGDVASIMTNIDSAVEDIRQTTSNIRVVSDQIQSGKGSFGRLLGDDGVINKVEETIESVNKIVKPASNLQLGVDYRGEFRADKSSQHYFNLLFQTQQDKYYLFGLTDVGTNIVRKRKDTSPFGDEGDNLSYETETSSEDKALRFNVQFAKRWYNLTMRFGLFESKGGVASDVHLFDNRLSLTVEAFDWNSGEATSRHLAHFKAYAKILLLDHITMIAGIDDPLRIDQATSRIREDINYFFSAGFTFNDNDLKGFLGTSALAL